jgi:hypothetical protein
MAWITQGNISAYAFGAYAADGQYANTDANAFVDAVKALSDNMVTYIAGSDAAPARTMAALDINLATAEAEVALINKFGIIPSSIISQNSIANTETVVVGITVPANTLVAGMTFGITAAGVGTTGATPGTGIWRVRIGPTTLTGNVAATESLLQTANRTTKNFWFDSIITIRTAGASGTALGPMAFIGGTDPNNLFSLTSILAIAPSPVVVDTTVENKIELTYISGNAGTTLYFDIACIYLLKQ